MELHRSPQRPKRRWILIPRTTCRNQRAVSVRVKSANWRHLSPHASLSAARTSLELRGDQHVWGASHGCQDAAALSVGCWTIKNCTWAISARLRMAGSTTQPRWHHRRSWCDRASPKKKVPHCKGSLSLWSVLAGSRESVGAGTSGSIRHHDRGGGGIDEEEGQ